jgi:hypothetical protein
MPHILTIFKRLLPSDAAEYSPAKHLLRTIATLADSGLPCVCIFLVAGVAWAEPPRGCLASGSLRGPCIENQHYGFLALPAGFKLITNGFPLRIRTDELAIKGTANIVAFPKTEVSKGRSSDAIEIVVRSAWGGTLVIDNSGEAGPAGGSGKAGVQGGNGAQGEGARSGLFGCYKGGGNGGAGLPGTAGEPGFPGGRGGNGGSVSLTVRETRDFHVSLVSNGGAGGHGGPGGLGGEGGRGGDGGPGLAYCGGGRPGPLGIRGADGPPGQSGPDGDRGEVRVTPPSLLDTQHQKGSGL